MILPEIDPPGLHVTETLWIPLPDGTRLHARIWRPETGAHPAILEALPYRHADGTAPRDALTHPWMAGKGYACVRLDLRGSGNSDGILADEYDETELSDIEAAIAWIADQPWCDGAVGMMGISWGGFNGVQVAMRRPPALRAVISIASTADRFGADIHYKGGALLGANLSWAAQMLSYQSRPPDPAVREDWREVWLKRLRAMPDFAARWHAEQRRSDYWKHGSVCEDFGSIAVPVLAVAGWADGYRNAPLDLVKGIPSARGIVGPWIHKYPHFAAPEPRIGFLQEALAWWDRHLKGRDAPDVPRMRLWRQDSVAPARVHAERPGRWCAYGEWPVGGTATLGLAPGRLGEAEAFETVVDSPPGTGACSGIFFPYAYAEEGPADQAADDARSVCFDGEVLDVPLDLIGRPAARLRVSCAAETATLAVRLCEVRSDGTSLWLSHGMLNLSHRDGSEAPAPMPEGPVEVTVTLDALAARLEPGSRLRLAVSTALWPFLWPSPERAPVTLHGGSLELPTAGEGEPWSFEPPVGAPPREAEVLRGATYERREADDEIVIVSDSGAVRDAGGLTVEERSEEVWRLDRPEARIVWHQDFSRGDWSVRTRAETAMRAKREAYLIETRLTAWEGDREVWDERRSHQVERGLF